MFFANGNMVKDLNKGIDSIYYNHLNLPYIVDMDNPGDSIVYAYDAAGIKLQQKVYENNALAKTTDYAGEFIYENGALQFIQHEEGRIIQEPDESYTYQYHLKDHLGNTRLTFTTGQYNSQYTATMEDAMYAQESEDFYNLDPTVQGPYPNSTKMVRLNSASPIGPALGLEVSRGDTINMSFTAYYEDATGHGTNSLGIAALASALTTAYGGLNGGSEGQQLIYDVFNNHAGVAVAAGGTADDTHPAAYLNYLVFDSEYNLISEQTGYVGIDDAPGIVQTKTLENLVIDQAGFIYIYLSNESNSSNYVFFDDFDVVIRESPVLETTDYYPFGGRFNSYTKPGTIDQNFKYNGKEEQSDLGLDWIDYGFRHYDPSIGRWHVKDPMSEKHYDYTPYAYVYNNPMILIDPVGLDSIYVFDQAQRPADNGTAGTSYTATIIVVQNGVITGIFDGSSYLNSVSSTDNSAAANTVNEGEKEFDNQYGHSRSRVRGLNIYDNENDRSAQGTSPSGQTVTMYGENMHSGTSNNGGPQSRGSLGCITVCPDQYEAFTDLFDWSGSITRTRSSVSSRSTADTSYETVTVTQNKDGSYTVTGSTGQSSGSIYIYRNQTDINNTRRDHNIPNILQNVTVTSPTE